MSRARIGCSGWNYREWRGLFYPQGLPARRWLECYAERFDTVEVNATFYRLPSRDTVAHWVEQTPDGFCFVLKASRYLTHVRRLQDIAEGVRTLQRRISPLRDAGRLGALLWQLPENFHRDDVRLRSLLAALPAGRNAIEFRHESWFADGVLAALRDHDVALVLGDHPQRSFQTHDTTASWRYLRFHYGARGRRGNYSERELDTWAKRVTRWRADGDVLAFFNNDWEGFAPRNAAYLRRRLTRASAGAGAGARATQGARPHAV
ncbi:MAG TPA: DUF72 domain-containing protein [Solirubrobacteraceae bacterium]|nr:DUF72 domain-containing protein [Solirubrobacteraceae bacterium]